MTPAEARDQLAQAIVAYENALGIPRGADEVLTDWTVVVAYTKVGEHSGEDGYLVAMLHDKARPYWQTTGMLHAALEDAQYERLRRRG